MRNFEGISFWWAIAIFTVIGLVYALRAFIGYRAVARDAEDDYNYKQPQGMIDKRLSKEGYIRAYKRFHNPRGPAYVAAAVGAILVLTWPAMALLELVLEQAWQLSGRSRVIEPGFLVWQFIIFFSIIGIWVAISYVVSKRYHRLAPGTLGRYFATYFYYLSRLSQIWLCLACQSFSRSEDRDFGIFTHYGAGY